jgi:hypothetical protein
MQRWKRPFDVVHKALTIHALTMRSRSAGGP